jgi:hypothetical protein
MNSIMIMGLLFALTAVVEPGTEQITVKDLSHYLPDSGLFIGWEPAHPPQTFVGDNLFDFINGGASIYYEYGFKQVITQQYVNADSQYLTLELYEMNNSAAAYGMYTYKTGASGKAIDIGADALLDDYYLNFWKGRFIGTVTGFGSGQESDEALLMFARAVADKITKAPRPPHLVGLLPTDSLHHPRIAYVKGVLGLSRHYMFDDNDIFEIIEAAIGDYGDHQIFVFKYRNVKQCLSVFQSVHDHFRNNPEYSGHTAYEGAFSILDNQEQHLHCTLYEQYLFVYIGTAELDPSRLFEIIRKNIK